MIRDTYMADRETPGFRASGLCQTARVQYIWPRNAAAYKPERQRRTLASFAGASGLCGKIRHNDRGMVYRLTTGSRLGTSSFAMVQHGSVD